MIKQRFSKSVSNLAEKSIELNLVNAKMQSVWNLFIIPYQAIFFLIAGWIHIQKGTPTVGTLLAFNNFISFLIYPLMSLLGSVANLGNMFASKQRVWTILYGNNDRQKKVTVQSASGDIVLQSIHFSYGEGEKVLQDVSFTIPEKKTTIVWGRSGSGKSTLAKLLLGLYQPIKGTITFVDQGYGAEVTACSKRMSLLEQQPFIFEGTIRANILLGRPDASETQLRKAASNACISTRIEQFPQGYDTVLDEKTPLSAAGCHKPFQVIRPFSFAPRSFLRFAIIV
jgi:ABC-type bacteriocin/lantibiotic exporter with double-glycine peptidase domain